MRHHVMGYVWFTCQARTQPGRGRLTPDPASSSTCATRRIGASSPATSYAPRRAQWQWTATLGPNTRQGRSTWFDRPGPPASIVWPSSHSATLPISPPWSRPAPTTLSSYPFPCHRPPACGEHFRRTYSPPSPHLVSAHTHLHPLCFCL